MKILITVMLAFLLIACNNKYKHHPMENNEKATVMSCINDRNLIPKYSVEWKRVTQRCKALDFDFVKKYGYHPDD